MPVNTTLVTLDNFQLAAFEKPIPNNITAHKCHDTALAVLNNKLLSVQISMQHEKETKASHGVAQYVRGISDFVT